MNILFPVFMHALRYLRSQKDPNFPLPQLRNGRTTYEVTAWLMLLLYYDPLKEKGEEADTKRKKKKRAHPNKTPQKLGKSFKKSQSSVCFSFYRPPSKFTQSKLYYKEWINTERFSKADLLELSLILKAECLFSLIWGSAPVKTAVKEASITRSHVCFYLTVEL